MLFCMPPPSFFIRLIHCCGNPLIPPAWMLSLNIKILMIQPALFLLTQVISVDDVLFINDNVICPKFCSFFDISCLCIAYFSVVQNSYLVFWSNCQFSVLGSGELYHFTIIIISVA